MTRRGRPRSWTEAQGERVRRLAVEGRSQRQIAEAVFGDARYRGRVERILRSTSRALPEIRPLADDAELRLDCPPTGDADVSSLREFVDRYRESLAASGQVPTLSEIERLLRIERQLGAMEQVERLNALTRERVGAD